MQIERKKKIGVTFKMEAIYAGWTQTAKGLDMAIKWP